MLNISSSWPLLCLLEEGIIWIHSYCTTNHLVAFWCSLDRNAPSSHPNLIYHVVAGNDTVSSMITQLSCLIDVYPPKFLCSVTLTSKLGSISVKLGTFPLPQRLSASVPGTVPDARNVDSALTHTELNPARGTDSSQALFKFMFTAVISHGHGPSEGKYLEAYEKNT